MDSKVKQIAADLRNWLSLHGYVKELPQEHEVSLLRAIKAAIEKATETLEAQLHSTSVDAVELLHFASLIEPYVSDAHCHGKTALDKKLYDACFNIRTVINRNVKAYIKGESRAAHASEDTAPHLYPTSDAGYIAAHLSCEALAKQDASDTTAFTHDAQPEEFESRAAHASENRKCDNCGEIISWTECPHCGHDIKEPDPCPQFEEARKLFPEVSHASEWERRKAQPHEFTPSNAGACCDVCGKPRAAHANKPAQAGERCWTEGGTADCLIHPKPHKK